ncbi:VOC family protein [Streptomyces sp. NPDC058691]|uniref:VOC family protein n=1 Tax=Streptomyces sp. NPDC058691 TaxID=3346601 RepID=UPI003657227C
MLSTDFLPGAPNWLDLGAPDSKAAAVYYGEVFGWEYVSAGPEAGGYGMFKIGDRTVAGIGPGDPSAGSAAWEPFFRTQDAEATAKLVEQAGGTVRYPAMDVFDKGRMAGFADSAGANFCVWQPGATKGVDLVNEPGSLYWTELYTTDLPAALGFYRSVLGWKTDDMSAPGFTYVVVSPGAGDDNAGHGGIAPLEEAQLAAGTTSHWLPYFTAADVDATVAKALAAGGSARVPATDMPGVGRFAQVVDPQGAVFAIITPADDSAF